MQITSVRHTKWQNYLVIKTTTDRRWFANIIQIFSDGSLSTHILTGDLDDETKLGLRLAALGAPVGLEWREGNGQF